MGDVIDCIVEMTQEMVVNRACAMGDCSIVQMGFLQQQNKLV